MLQTALSLHQITNPSMDGVRLYDGLRLSHLSTVSVVSPDQLHANAVANSSFTDEGIRHAKSYR